MTLKVGDWIAYDAAVFEVSDIKDGMVLCWTVVALCRHTKDCSLENLEFELYNGCGWIFDKPSKPKESTGAAEISFDRDAPSQDYTDSFDILKSMLGG